MNHTKQKKSSALVCIDVVAAIMQNEKKELLIALRSDEQFFWEFPGGKIEQGETPHEALKRELKEELNIDSICIEACFDSYVYHYPKKSVRLHFFLCSWIQANTMKKNVHLNIQWVALNNLNLFEFLPGNQRVLEKLMLRV